MDRTTTSEEDEILKLFTPTELIELFDLILAEVEEDEYFHSAFPNQMNFIMVSIQTWYSCLR